MNAETRFPNGNKSEVMNGDAGACTDACTNSPDTVQIDAGIQHVIDALAALPEADCPVVIAHIRALVSMSSSGAPRS